VKNVDQILSACEETLLNYSVIEAVPININSIAGFVTVGLEHVLQCDASGNALVFG